MENKMPNEKETSPVPPLRFSHSIVRFVAQIGLKIAPLWGTIVGLAAYWLLNVRNVPFQATKLHYLVFFGLFLDACDFIFTRSARFGVKLGTEQGFAAGRQYEQQQSHQNNCENTEKLNETAAMCILGLRPGYSAEDVRAAYREKAKLFHPDAGGNDELFRTLQRARDYLLKGCEKGEHAEKLF